MTFINYFKKRKMNKLEIERRTYSNFKKRCINCKYCKMIDIIEGYDVYRCKLKNPDFECTDTYVEENICDDHEFKKIYKKYNK